MSKNRYLFLAAALIALIALAACGAPAPEQNATALEPSSTANADPSHEPETPTATPEPLPEYNIVTLLPRDAIPAIFEPRFLTVEEANQEYSDNELVLGVEIDGEAHAYSVPFLSSHEIVNDIVGGKPIAVTW